MSSNVCRKCGLEILSAAPFRGRLSRLTCAGSTTAYLPAMIDVLVRGSILHAAEVLEGNADVLYD